MNIKSISIAKKIFTLVFAVGLCFSSFGTPRARAVVFVPVSDGMHTIQGTITAVSTPVTAVATPASAVANVGDTLVNTAHTGWSTIGKNTLNTLAYQAGQIALNQLTDNTIAWIRGGFHGSPSFNVDTQAMGEELADSVTLGLVSQIKSLAVCDFDVDVSFVDNLTDSYQLAKKKKMPIKCPFDESVTKINATFYASDVETAVNSFSWELFSAALNDAGNPYGVQIVTANEQAAQQAKTKANSDQKQSWSNGYADLVDTNDCKYPSEIKKILEGTPASEATGGLDPGTGEQIPTQEVPPETDPAKIAAWQKQYCKTTTPGNIVGSQLTKTLGLDMDRLGFADNLNKIISALLTVAVQSAVRSVF